MDVDLMGDMGAYSRPSGLIPMAARHAAGLYDIQALHPLRVARVTIPCRSMPIGRGADVPTVRGRASVMPARANCRDADAIRRRLHPRAPWPYRPATGRATIPATTGAHERAWRRGVEGNFQARKAAKMQGLVRASGSQAMSRSRVMGRSRQCPARSDGDVTILIGTQFERQATRPPTRSSSPSSSGFAHASTSQAATPRDRDRLGTAARPRSSGGSASSAPRAISAAMKELAAEALETSAGDLESTMAWCGSPHDRSISFVDLAKRAGGDTSKLNASATFASADGTYPNGTTSGGRDRSRDRHRQDVN